MKKVKLKEVLKQYRNTHRIQDNQEYGQVTISQKGNVYVRGRKYGSKIGRKRQFLIDLKDHPNTLIFIRQGVMKGGIGLCPPEVDGCVVTENMPMFEIVNINPDYLLNFIKSPQFKEEVSKLVPIGTAQKALHERKLLEIQIPLPSKEKQKKLLSKIKSIEKEIKQLEQNITKDETLLKKLKQSILSEAVQGKLVPQDPKDEPASELLKKIKAEKEKLIKEGKIKKGKELPPIEKDEVPYELPKGWVWTRLGDLSINIHYGFNASANANKDIKLLRITDIQNNKVNWDTVPGCIISEKEYKNYALNKNDILIARTGGTIGKSFLIEELNKKAVFASYLIRVIPSKKSYARFIKLFIESPIYWEQLFEASMGTGQPNVNGTALKSLKFPLPPLPEQKRIVEKVDNLMKMCDELELRIKENKGNSEKLMGAVLREVFEDGN